MQHMTRGCALSSSYEFLGALKLIFGQPRSWLNEGARRSALHFFDLEEVVLHQGRLRPILNKRL